MAGPGALDAPLPESVVLAETIRDRVLRVPGVLALSPGYPYREATYGPGITVWGVGLSMQSEQVEVDVHVVAAATPLPVLAQEVRRVVQAAISETTVRAPGPINVHIDDIVVVEQRVTEAQPL